MNLILEREIELVRLVCLVVVQDGSGFSKIVIAIVAEVDDLASDLLLKPLGGLDLGDQEPLGEETARLLPKADNRTVHDANSPRRFKIACRTPAKARHNAQPMTLYQR